mmetsp:Transcript_67538/g.162143  ORF Transcript_67538/g.162143 Transcript_67538/m.162143 type:complete len:86 (+) Transcript_67538:630-887(+)
MHKDGPVCQWLQELIKMMECSRNGETHYAREGPPAKRLHKTIAQLPRRPPNRQRKGCHHLQPNGPCQVTMPVRQKYPQQRGADNC